ncbi:MAG: Ig domain-containing protein, partial [Luminiphilus sp.]
MQLDAVQITINPTLSYAAVTGELGTALNVSPVVPPSVVPGVFALTGTLPQGLSFNTATGAVTGTPTEVIATPLTVSLTVPEPSGDLVTSTALSIDIKSYPITFTYPDGAGEVGQPLTITPTVSGTKGAVTFSLLAQTPLPAGMTLDPGTGEISGTPTESGAFPVQVRVTDQYSTQSAAAAIRVQAPLPQPAAVPLLDRFELLLLAIATLFVGWVGLRRFCIRL